MEQLLDRINKLSLAARAGIVAAIIILVTAAMTYFVFLPLEEDIDRRTAELAGKEAELALKQAVADNLNEKRREMDRIDQLFQEALTELPEKKDIEELLAQLSDLGKKSGLEVSKVVPLAEAAENGFISKVPVNMTVSGNYHEIAIFLQEIANLRRIVNVSNIKLTRPELKNDRVILGSEFVATTFRFAEQKSGTKGKAQ